MPLPSSCISLLKCSTTSRVCYDMASQLYFHSSGHSLPLFIYVLFPIVVARQIPSLFFPLRYVCVRVREFLITKSQKKNKGIVLLDKRKAGILGLSPSPVFLFLMFSIVFLVFFFGILSIGFFLFTLL